MCGRKCCSTLHVWFVAFVYPSNDTWHVHPELYSSSVFKVAIAMQSSGLPPLIDIALDPLFTPEVVKKVRDMLDSVKRSGEKVSTCDKIKHCLETAGIGWFANIQPSHCGVSQANRSKLGVVGSDSQFLGELILQNGWSTNKCKESTCFQVPPSPWNEDAVRYNDELSSYSDGLIPPIHTLQALSVGGSHTNTFLRQCNAKVRCVVKSLDNGSGELSAEHLSVGRPAFAEALRVGIRFFMIHWQAEVVWADLADLLQDALNIQSRLDQSEVEIMLRLQQLAANFIQAHPDREVPWVDFERSAAKSNPSCSNWIGLLSKYVQKHAGGVSGELLAELAAVAKSLQGESGPKRTFGSEFIAKVNSLNFGVGIIFPYVINSILELQLSAAKTVDGVCKFLTPSNLMEMVKPEKRAAVQESEKLMAEARKLVVALGLSKSATAKVVGRLDVRLCAFLNNKSKDLERSETSISEISKKFLQDLSKIHGQTVNWSIATTSDTPPPADEVAASHTSINRNFDTIEQQSNLVFQARKLGFKNDAFIVRRNNEVPEIYKFVDFATDVATVVLQEGGHNTVESKVPVDELLRNWRLHKGTVATVLPVWDPAACPCSPLDTKQLKYELARCKIIAALAKTYAQFETHHMEVELLINPASVRVKTVCEPHTLVLAPMSTKIERKKTESAICVGEYDLGEARMTSLFLSPMFTAPQNKDGEFNKTPWVVPLYSVKGVKGASTNMEMKYVECGGVHVPVLMNTKRLGVGAGLRYDKDKSVQKMTAGKHAATVAASTVARKKQRV